MHIVLQGGFCGFPPVVAGAAPAIRRMTDPEMLERIAARRAKLVGIEAQPVKQLSDVRAERVCNG
ncbi:hypothetical protein OG418_48930 [Streptomyces phaeochromogenes]|uniref:hypothetical protein n=1 Tax=Streptomyces phaeochromogenes TaxID=1923 RepID=UPI0032455C3C